MMKLVLLTLGLSTVLVFANPSPPQWWGSAGDPGSVLSTASSDNGAAANVGQAKWIAKSALQHLEARAVSSDPSLISLRNTLLKSSPEANDGVFYPNRPDPLPSDWAAKQMSVLNTGQAKAIAKPFYDVLPADWIESQLQQSGLVEAQGTAPEIDSGHYYRHSNGRVYPWPEVLDGAANMAPVSLGQLKLLFSLRFENLLIGANLFIGSQTVSSGGSIQVRSGYNYSFWTIIYRLDGSTEAYTRNLTWESSDSNIATPTDGFIAGYLSGFFADLGTQEAGSLRLVDSDSEEVLLEFDVEITTEEFNELRVRLVDRLYSPESVYDKVVEGTSHTLEVKGVYYTDGVEVELDELVLATNHGTLVQQVGTNTIVYTAPAIPEEEVYFEVRSDRFPSKFYRYNFSVVEADPVIAELSSPKDFDARLSNAGAVPNLDIFTSYSSGNGTATWNPNVWFGVDDLDLSGVSFFRGTTPVVVHPRIVVTAAHVKNIGQNASRSSFYFTSKNGDSHYRYVELGDYRNLPGTDIRVSLLNADLPIGTGDNQIAMYKLPPTPTEPALGQDYYGAPIVVAAWHSIQHRLGTGSTSKGDAMLLPRLRSNGIGNFDAHRSTQGKRHPLDSNYFGLIVGDSSSPWFYYTSNAELIFATTSTNGGGGNGTDLANPDVQAALLEAMDDLLPGAEFQVYTGD